MFHYKKYACNLCSVFLVSIVILLVLNYFKIVNFDFLCEEFSEPRDPLSSKNQHVYNNLTDKLDIDTIHGTPIKDVPAFSKVNDAENKPPVLGGNSMFAFKYANCKPECCEFGKSSGYSCSTGCICANEVSPMFQKNNNYVNQYDSYGNIINDKYSKPMPLVEKQNLPQS
jgi:hypothetical protein